MPKIIAFGHQKRVGKDTAGRFVMTHVRTTKKNSHIVKGGYADKLKDVCYQLYKWAGLLPADFYEEHPEMREVILPLLGKTPRQLWIGVGNKLREVYMDTWLDYFLNNIKADVIINTDTRFPNEADRIKEHGGIVVRILRPEIEHTSDDADDPLLEYTGWSETIINDGDLGELYNKVTKLVDNYL